MPNARQQVNGLSPPAQIGTAQQASYMIGSEMGMDVGHASMDKNNKTQLDAYCSSKDFTLSVNRTKIEVFTRRTMK